MYKAGFVGARVVLITFWYDHFYSNPALYFLERTSLLSRPEVVTQEPSE